MEAAPATSTRRLAVTGLAVIALIGLALGAATHRGGEAHGGTSTTKAMAQRIGCADTYRDANQPGTSLSAGECTLDDASIELRVYRTAGEANAWLDGAKGQSPDPGTAGWGGVGDGWAVRVAHTTSADLVNRVLTAVGRAT